MDSFNLACTAKGVPLSIILYWEFQLIFHSVTSNINFHFHVYFLVYVLQHTRLWALCMHIHCRYTQMVFATSVLTSVWTSGDPQANEWLQSVPSMSVKWSLLSMAVRSSTSKWTWLVELIRANIRFVCVHIEKFRPRAMVYCTCWIVVSLLARGTLLLVLHTCRYTKTTVDNNYTHHCYDTTMSPIGIQLNAWHFARDSFQSLWHCIKINVLFDRVTLQILLLMFNNFVYVYLHSTERSVERVHWEERYGFWGVMYEPRYSAPWGAKIKIPSRWTDWPDCQNHLSGSLGKYSTWPFYTHTTWCYRMSCTFKAHYKIGMQLK